MFGQYSYLVWMLVFALPPIGILWACYGRVLWRNRRAIGVVVVIGLLYQFVADPFAEAWRAWFFGNDKILGLRIGNFPIENTIFFALISVAISSFVIAGIGQKSQE